MGKTLQELIAEQRANPALSTLPDPGANAQNTPTTVTLPPVELRVSSPQEKQRFRESITMRPEDYLPSGPSPDDASSVTAALRQRGLGAQRPIGEAPSRVVSLRAPASKRETVAQRKERERQENEWVQTPASREEGSRLVSQRLWELSNQPQEKKEPEESKAVEAVTNPDLDRAGQAGGGGGGVIPAHDVPLINPERIARIGAAEDAEEQAVRAGGEASVNEQQVGARGLGERRDLLAQQAEDVAARAAERDEHIGRHLDNLDAMSREVASMKYDPDRYYKNLDPGKQALFAISAVFSGFANGWTKNTGAAIPALEVIQKGIDREMHAQAQEIEAKKGRLADMKGILAETYRRFGNMDAAVAASNALSLEAVDTKIKQYAAASKVPSVQAAANLALAQLQKAKEIELAKFYQYVQQQAYGPATGPEGAVYKMGEDETTVPIGGGRALVVPKGDAEHIYAASRGLAGVRAAGQRLIALSKVPFTSRGPEWYAQTDSTLAAISQAEIMSGGKGGKGISEEIKNASGGVGGITHIGMEKAVRGTIQGAQDRFDASTGGSGRVVVEPTPTRNAKGEVVMKHLYRGAYEPQGQAQGPAPVGGARK